MIGFTIPKNALVIDIGSGDKPFWRADVFLDDLHLSNNQRMSGMDTVTDLGVFINGNIMKTKFKKKLFDFSYCTHLLEHIENPSAAIREITRISKSGYIEVPNGVIECIKPFISHLWLVFFVDNQLVFVRKSKNFNRITDKNGKYYSYLLKNVHNPFIQIHWRGKINYKIINDLSDKDVYTLKKYVKHPAKINSKLYLNLVKLLRAVFYTKKQVNVTKLLPS